ncbi:MAG TPA: acyl-ACP--UDP-N-acetylglucosamine O-acyltransferase [Thermoanaerobaculia bacterium]|nr:acyl-ACP--UDP-N-acetylglucosamine O-acyltransferase [Thermoanaerobaculia bacterium]
MSQIHPTAVIDPTAELGADVQIGPYAVVGAEVRIGDRCEIGAAAQIAGPSALGPENRVFPHACLGLPPQDLKFRGERTTLEIGAGNEFREFCTVHRGTVSGGGRTSIGDHNLFMTYSHVAHDCHVGSHTVFSNCGTLAGHVEVQDWAVIGAFTAVHQFTRVGAHAYLGGYTRLILDALPFAISVGLRAQCIGLNRIGLQRRSFDDATIETLEKALRLVARSPLTKAAEELRQSFWDVPAVRQLVEFAESSERGFTRTTPRRSAAEAGPDGDE